GTRLVGALAFAQESLQEPLTDEELKQCWWEDTLCLAYGRSGEGQVAGEEREKAWHGSSGAKHFPGKAPPVVLCSKGNANFLPNQDNFCIAYLKNGWTLAICADGHGIYGQLISTRVVQTLAYAVVHELAGQEEHQFIPALEAAFDFVQKDLHSHATKFGWDCEGSGSAIAMALYKGSTVFMAHCGDCRCVIGLEHTGGLVFATQDHKPDVMSEQERIDAAGGEVRSQIYPDGWVVHRVFARGQELPGLCKSRSLGDLLAKEVGVTAVPDVAVVEVKLARKPFILLASDGIWEFLDSEFVVKAIAKILATDGPSRTLQKLQREARKRWRQEEGETCDDTTAILIRL
ncbi:unnamed protein product, partial [Effrenium voratum]